MDAAGEELADRVRAMLSGEPMLEEKRMLGTRAFLLGGRILVGARNGGTLLVRVEAERGTALLLRPGVSAAPQTSAGSTSCSPTTAGRCAHGRWRCRAK
ncbi:hypothetical protein [Microbacterium sp.]|uniref:hypothetical protein n=1 Tax=Microbacterium sp. TaxID=51671 RepID=UPI0039E5AAFD